MYKTVVDLINLINSNGTTEDEDTVISQMEGIGLESTTFVSDTSSVIVSIVDANIKLAEVFNIGDSTAYITLTSDFLFNYSSGVVQFDSEEIKFQNIVNDITSIHLTNLTRGYNSTVEDSHLIDTTGIIVYFIRQIDNSHFDTVLTPGDSTAIMAWRIINYENTYNQALRSKQDIIITDSFSPRYPIPDWSPLLTFDATNSIDYSITDSSTEIYIQSEFPTIQTCDSVYLQGGINGIQDYPSYSNYNIIAFCIGYSEDGNTWNYICQDNAQTYLEQITDGSSINVIQEIILTSNKSTAINNPLWYMQEFPLTIQETIHLVRFPQTIKSKYFRIYLLDLLPFLTFMGIESGYTGYTASISHVKFEGKRYDAKTLVTDSISTASIDPRLFVTGVIYQEKTSFVSGNIVGNEFMFPFDDGYSGFSGILTMICKTDRTNTTGGTTFYLQVKNPTGFGNGWNTIGIINTVGSANGTLTAAFSEVPRVTGKVKRSFRVYAITSYSTPTLTVEGGGFICYLSNWNTFANW